MNSRLDITKYLASGLGRAMLNLSSEAESSGCANNRSRLSSRFAHTCIRSAIQAV